MSSSSKKTSIPPLDFNIITQTLDKQCKSQSDLDDNTDMIEIFISEFSSHHTEIPVTYSELHIFMIIKNHSHWQSLLEFSQEQLKNDSIQLKLDTITNQIDDHLAADFYELVAAWQQARTWDNIWVAQLAADLEETQQHQDEYQKVYQTAQTELQKLQTQLNIMNKDYQAILQQIQDWDIWIQCLKTVIDQFNITPLHTPSNFHVSV